MTVLSSPICDADLHGLVDGHLDLSRRAELLRRLARSPEDRLRVEAWQDQADMLRAAFGGIEREPLPVTLDLAPRPRLRCVSNEQMPISLTPTGTSGVRRGLVAGVVALGLAVLIGCIWFALASSHAGAPIADLRVRGSADEALRARAVTALGEAAPKTRIALPTLTIPDLEAAGFSLVAVETRSAVPASLLLRYRNAAFEPLVISVTRGAIAPLQPPMSVGGVYIWHSRDNAFAMASTIKPDRLQAIATGLQSDDLP